MNGELQIANSELKSACESRLVGPCTCGQHPLTIAKARRHEEWAAPGIGDLLPIQTSGSLYPLLFVRHCNAILADRLSTLESHEQEALRVGSTDAGDAWNSLWCTYFENQEDDVRPGWNLNEGVVYFVLAEQCGVIKIGRTYNLDNRLKDLQGQSPAHLELMAFLPERGSTEIFLHRYFSRTRLHREWFAPSLDLILLCLGAWDTELGDDLDRHILTNQELAPEFFNEWLNLVARKLLVVP